MAFLRNTYILVDFGDFVNGSTSDTDDPYIQLLSITNDTAVAHADFIRARGSSSGSSSTKDKTERIVRIVLISLGCALALALAALFACCYCVRKGLRRAPKSMETFFSKNPYAPLGKPAPVVPLEAVRESNYSPPPGPPPSHGAQQYHNGYEHP